MSSDQEARRGEEATRFVEVSPTDLQALTPDKLKELQERFGLEVQIRSSSAGIAKILGAIGRPGDISRVAVYDRGFDRTSPGYDKYYDRDRSSVFDKVLDPPEFLDPAELKRRAATEER